MRHKAFKNTAQEYPLPIKKDADCGIQEPFNSGQCVTALAKRGAYMSGFNFFWLDLLRSPTPGIPLSRQRVKGLGGWMCMKSISPLNKPIGVAVNSPDFPVDAHKGSLLMTTPEELDHAILLKVAADVRHGAKNHKQWRLVLLSVQVYIDVFMKKEQVQLAAHIAKQQLLQYHWSLSRTAQQQCYDVVAVNNTFAENIVSVAREEGDQRRVP